MNLRPRPTAHPREGIVRGWRTSQLLIRRKYQASLDLSFRPPKPACILMHPTDQMLIFSARLLPKLSTISASERRRGCLKEPPAPSLLRQLGRLGGCEDKQPSR